MGLFDIFRKKQQTPDFSPVDPNAGYGEYPSDWPMELKIAQAAQHFQDGDDFHEYIFCSVVFSEGGKAYYYLSDDQNIQPGNYVTVPVGRQNEENTARVVKVEVFQGNNAPVPVDCLKYIIEIQD